MSRTRFRFSALPRVVAVIALLAVASWSQASWAAAPKAAKAGKEPSKGVEKTEVKFVRVPDGGLQPQAAVDNEGTLHLVYLGDDPGAANIYYVRKGAGQEKFSRPICVNSQSGSAIAVGSIRGAHLAIGKGQRVHVAWNGSGTAEPRGPKKYDSPMLYTRLADDGNSFEPQRSVNGEKYGLDGGGSVAADLEGNVYVAWHGGDGSGEQNRRVFVVKSTDEGKSFAPDVTADKDKNGACGCCGLRAFADRQGTLYLLYRGARDMNNRDMFLLTSGDGARSFDSLLADKWMVSRCPMSSEAFVDGRDAVMAAWETDSQIYVSRIDKKKGREPSKPLAPTGKSGDRKHPAMAVNGQGETLLVWTEGTGWNKGGGLAWQLFNDKGRPTTTRGRLDKSIPVWSFAAVYAEPDDSFVILH
ncbi:MAG: hypothetical protein HY290_09460 [Planctomycetia bacterium]|nr:hypothetical protein [Planctomycetia bacterium]